MKQLTLHIFCVLLASCITTVALSQNPTPDKPKNESQEAFETFGRILRGMAIILDADLEEVRDTLQAAQQEIQALDIHTDSEHNLIVGADTVPIQEKLNESIEILNDFRDLMVAEEGVERIDPASFPPLADQFLIMVDLFSHVDLENLEPDEIARAFDEAFKRMEQLAKPVKKHK